MKSSVTKSFRKRLGDLPALVEEQANKAYTFCQKLTEVIAVAFLTEETLEAPLPKKP